MSIHWLRPAYAFVFLVGLCALTGAGLRLPTEQPEALAIACPHPDYAALMALYNSTDGPNWTNNTGWADGAEMTNCDPCSGWFGVSCNGNDRVVCLDLDGGDDCGFTGTGNNLTGELPAEIGQLAFLEEMEFSNNNLSGAIPADLFGIEPLRSVSITNNELTDPIPTQVGDANNLSNLILHSNQITGSLPDELGNLRNLQILFLHGNNLTGAIPSTIGGAESLRRLNLRDNNLSGGIPEEIGQLTNLEELILERNSLGGEIPAALYGLTQLEFLNLSICDLSGPLTGISALSNLLEFYANDNDFSGPIPTELWTMANLSRIDLSSTGFTGSISSDISNLTSLRDISLADNDLSGQLPASITTLANLQTLLLFNNALEGSIPTGFGNIASLTNLSLENNDLTGCIPQDLHSRCGALTVGLTGNIGLAFGGNFTQYCETASGSNSEQLAASCDDNDTNTQNDQIQSDCSCAGLPVCPTTTAPATAPLCFNGIDNVIDLTAYNAEVGGGAQVQWWVDESGNMAIINPTAYELPRGETTVFAIASNEECSSEPQPVTFTVFDALELVVGCTLSQFATAGNNDGAIRVSIFGGTPPYSITYSGPLNGTLNGAMEPTEIVAGLPAGGYDITLTDSNGCSATTFITVSLPFDNGCNTVRDSLALLALFNATNGSNWSNTNIGNNGWADGPNWLTPELPFREWEGITVGPAGCVTILDLDGINDGTESFKPGGLGMIGPLPDSVGQLKNLRELYLTDNFNLGGALPDSIYTLTELSLLFVNNVELDEAIQPELASMTGLSVLGANFNRLTFADMLPGIPGYEAILARDGFVALSPQDSVGTYQRLEATEGEDLIFSLNFEINDNRNVYAWYLDDALAQGSTGGAGTLTLSNVQAEDAGLYYARITHPDLPGVELSARPVEIVVLPLPTCSDGIQNGDETGVDCGGENCEPCPCEHPDFEALMAIYEATEGENWINNEGWAEGFTGESCDVCSWYGVECDDLTGRVNSLDLDGVSSSLFSPNSGGNNLVGSFPPQIGDLVELERLSIGGDSSLTGEISTSIGNLVKLKQLFLFQLGLEGELPNSFCQLVSLEDLFLGYTSIRGELPSCFGNLNSMRGASIVFNNFSGPLPSGIGNWVNVRFLSFDSNQLTGSIPNSFANLDNLSTFRLSNNRLSGTIPSVIGAMNSLSNLALINNDFSGFIPDTLAKRTSLVALYLRENSLTGSIPEAFGSIPELRILDLRDNELSGTIPAALGNAPLSQLLLESNLFDGQIPEGLYQDSLRLLRLRFNQLEGCIPEDLINMCEPGRELYMTGNPSLAWEGELAPFCDSGGSSLAQIGAPCTANTGQSGEEILENCSCGIPCPTPSMPASLMICPEENNSVDLTSLDAVITGGQSNISVLWYDDLAASNLIVNPDTFPITDNLSVYARVNNGLCTSDSVEVQVLFFDGPQLECINNGTNYLITYTGNIPPFSYSLTVAGSTQTGTEFTPIERMIPLEQPGIYALKITDANGCVDSCGINFIPPAPTCNDNTMNGEEYGIDCGGPDCAPCLGCNRLRDSFALVALYNATNGPAWSRAENWLTDAPLEEWYGIVTDGTTCVKGIDLRSNGLSGELPAEFWTIRELESLRLTNNLLTGTLPVDLRNFSRLRTCRLDENSFSGSIPAQFGELPFLEWLHLGSNNFENRIPTELRELSRLRYLNVERNNLMGPIPSELGELVELRELRLSDNPLNSSIPREIGQLRELTLLAATNCGLINPIPSSLGQLSNIQIVALANNNLSSSIPAELGDLPSLQRLLLHENNLSGRIPSSLGRLASLEYLLLAGNQLTGTVPEELSGLSNLTRLYLNDNDLEGCVPAEVLAIFCQRGEGNPNTFFPGFLISGNPKLPFAGEFSGVCGNVSPIGAPCSTNTGQTGEEILEDCSCGIPCPSIFAATARIVCPEEAESINLSLSDAEVIGNQSEVSVIWYDNPAATNLIADPLRYAPIASTTVYARVTNGLCLSDSVAVNILLLEGPVLNCTTSDREYFVNYSGGTPPYAYELTLAGTVETGTDTTPQVRTLSLEAAGRYSLIITDANGCVDSCGIDFIPPPPTCDDGFQNGEETGIDCGGPDCIPCACEVATRLDSFLCAGSSILINGTVYDEDRPTGNEVIITPGACDTLLAISLRFSPRNIPVLSDQLTLCTGDTLFLSADTFVTNTRLEEMLVDRSGCDSLLLITDLTFQITDTIRLENNICPEESIPFFNQIITQPGDYYHTNANAVMSCDTTFWLHVETSGIPERNIVNDTFSLLRSDDKTELSVLSNDTLPPGASLELVDFPDFGDLDVFNNRLVFKPDGERNGIDSFHYRVCLPECPDQCPEGTVILDVGFDCLLELREKLPNAITPDEDGFNDIFDPRGFAMPGCENAFEFMKIVIYNRAGHVVFSPPTYAPWPGTNNQRQPLGTGTYIYRLFLEGVGETEGLIDILKRRE